MAARGVSIALCRKGERRVNTAGSDSQTLQQLVDQVERERRAQGLPTRITDVVALTRLAARVRGSRCTPSGSSPTTNHGKEMAPRRAEPGTAPTEASDCGTNAHVP
jgi:hypothetical protein